ncbi:CMGC/SRPK protein kinase [Panus rudis PR-1116 ss-1]|nr:CMGC/SRPK protein kinase [Panus rudis PR-1116 ss-1]
MTGFSVIDNKYLVEEEGWEWYSPEQFYPVRIGEVFNSQYQVVGKLGYGAYATVWLCRDLLKHRHVAVKIGTYDALSKELSVLKYLSTIRTKHAGATLVRRMLDEFQVTRDNKKYQAIVHLPMAATLGGFRNMLSKKKLPDVLLKPLLQYLLIALDFLHSEAKVVHTDIQEKNILLGLDEKSAEADLEKFEEEEMKHPSPRKIDGDKIIYGSRRLVPPVYNYGQPVLCDLGEARFGDYDPMIDIQPYQYRAPEIWDLFENRNLFNTRGGPENKQDNIYHLAHMVALLGPPPREFLERSKTGRPWQWFDRDGNWKGAAEIPDTSFEHAEQNLKGEDKTQFLKFVRRMLKWKPEERETAKELLKDPWLTTSN